MSIAFDHVFRLTDEVGIFEHAELTVPRREHAYCVDDVARGLVVVLREPERAAALTSLVRLYFEFIVDAQAADGGFHNRRGLEQVWTDTAGVEDCWGRALWALGTVAARDVALRDRALVCFELGARRRSPWSRAMTFAALGAAEILSVDPTHDAARRLLSDAAAWVGAPAGRRPGGDDWPWPEPRLTYANAALAEVMLAAGSLLDEPRVLRRGLEMLTWLLEIETQGDHISVTPVGGWEPGEERPAFDQQPIEVATLADACARAYDVTSEDRWRDAVRRCADWFHGANDSAVPLLDPLSGGGCDGLELAGRNENQGAESTLAMISTFQQAARICR